MARQQERVAGTLVLDAQGLVKLAAGDPAVRALVHMAREGNHSIVTAASTLADVLRGGPKDAAVYRALRHVTIETVSKEAGRKAGELIGRSALGGHQHTVDSLLAVIALAQRRPAVLLTSNPGDMARLIEEPGRAISERIAIVTI